jgi:alpha-tubulin suppressor-like RCC1 family protein
MRVRDLASFVVVTIVAALAAALAPTASASAGSVSRWGSYLAGSQEAGPPETQFEPAAVGLTDVSSVAAGNSSSYALKADGSVWAWGNGTVGQLGNGSVANSSSPVAVAFPQGVVITAIGESKNQGFAIDSGGEPWTWGQGTADCMPGRMSSRPVRIPNLTQVVEVQGGQNHVLWRKRDGTVLGCGTNGDGQLGLGDEVANAKTPMVVPGLQSIVQISTGNRTLEARDSSGRVFMAGENTRGQIGVGSSEENIWTPTQVPLPEPATSISAGGDLVPNGTSFAITAGGLYGWGSDEQGQVGDQQTAPKRSPVNTGLHFTTVASGGAFVLGLDSAGNLYSWGSNAGGALGMSRKGGRALTPVLVDSSIATVSATAFNALDVHN